MRRCFWSLPALLIMLGVFSCRQVPQQPNVVFILVDDLGATDLGCTGSEFYETPHLDRLAENAVLFTQAYAANPVCSPTRAALLSGQHPQRLRITDWIPGRDPRDRKLLGPQDLHQLPLETQTWVEIFKEQGYKTFFAGKWHLGGEGFYPEHQGFDINLGGHDKGSPPGGYYSPYSNPLLSDGPEGEYLPDRLTDESITFLEGVGEQPFVLYLSFYTVHTPIQASQRHLAHYEQKRANKVFDGPGREVEHDGENRLRQDRPDYASMVQAMDENVGRLLSKLEALDLDDETLVVFTSDNGGLSTLYPGQNAPTANLGLRAGKGWCYEGGIRVPLIMRIPGLNHPGKKIPEPVISTDLFPTLLDFAGLSLPEGYPADGTSLRPLFSGEDTLARDALYWHFPHYHGSAWTPGSAVRAGDWKLIKFYDKEKSELYYLPDDPREQMDLAAQYPEKVAALTAQLAGHLKAVKAQMPVPNPDFVSP